ncbi:MAG: 4-hydroxythreonine-4-phosphate dehydrogenase PdxA [Moorellaceae bacterium]
MSRKPLIGITLGDPAGVGPEIVVKALAKAEIYEVTNPVIIGEKKVLERALELTGLELKLNPVDAPREGKYEWGTIDFIDLKNLEAEIPVGQVNPLAGKAAFEFIKKAIELALNDEIDGVATAPINKEAIHGAGINFIGHTEMFSELTGSKNTLTMFQVQNLRIFFLTRHISLLKACAQVTANRIVRTLFLCEETLHTLGFEKPRLAVAALNPHGGEGGLFGDEEVKEIIPAVEQARASGLRVEGPIAADSVFYLANKGYFDAVLSLYHDQGHIAAKMLDFERTVSVTTGLPFIRTSVDHGTAFDIAGRGVASSISMEEAIKVAGGYAFRVKHNKKLS